MQFDRDFREFVECLVARDVRFLVVGGYAVAAHGHPRYTGDLDGVAFDDCYPRRMLLELGGVTLPFIGADDLRRNKRSSGRPQDLADLAALDG